MPETRVDFDRYRDSYRAAVQESIAFSGADLDFFTRAKAAILLELVAESGGDANELAFLDVGCGPGETDRFLEGAVKSLAGVDVSPGILEVARGANPWAEYRAYSPGDAIPHETASFDVCFAICVLHHVPAAERVGLVEEMARVAKPGGLIAVFEHNPFNPLTRKAVAGCEFDRDAKLLSRGTASRILKRAGLERPRGRYIEFFPRDGELLRRVERGLRRLPLGAQYVVFAERP